MVKELSKFVKGGKALIFDFTASVNDAGKRLDTFLPERMPDFSRSRLQSWIKSERVRVNGAPSRTSYSLKTGDHILVEPADLEPLHARAEQIELSVLYEDSDLVAIDKPAGMVVHAGAGVHSGTLVNALLHRFESLSGVGGALRPGIVHRLDRYTSGVVLIAKTDVAHRNLAAQFAARETRKIYLTMVHGVMKSAAGSIEKPIARDPSVRARMTTRIASGRAAISQYRLLHQFAKFSFLEVRILTGRTHQIRVHLASIGHPVVGDRLYGAPAVTDPALDRYFLHAHQITVARPSNGEPLTVTAPLAPELEAWKSALAD